MKYPIGIQSFEKIRLGEYTYVDKTALIHQLVNTSNYYFLSRPRRFGKSLLISTLEAYFNGQQELFKGLEMEQLEKEWTKYPVLHLDLNTSKYDEKNSLINVLNDTLCQWESIYGTVPSEVNPELRFKGIIRRAYEQTGQRVVILVDEYDKPMLQSIGNEELQNEYRNTLKAFYSVMKTQDRYIRFGFLTGVTKFGKVSVFSDLNNLIDLSMDRQFQTLCGMTDKEIHTYFEEPLHQIAENYGITYDEVCLRLKERYDGYRFRQNGTNLYNPFSLLNTFRSLEFGSYWFETGTPTYLVKLLKDNNFCLPDLTSEGVTAETLTDVESFKDNPIAVIYQSGYLTIKEYDEDEKNSFLADYKKWDSYNSELISRSFDDNDSPQSYYRVYGRTGDPTRLFGEDIIKEAKQQINEKVVCLESIMGQLPLIPQTAPNDNNDRSVKVNMGNKDVFIVHGHDSGLKNEVARFITDMGYNPIILHEQPNTGKTIIEKIEAFTNVCYAIVLYTPCDKGASKDCPNVQPRARQNVVFEHGYLIGKLGRERVCALIKEEVEKPGDVDGVVYVSYDGRGAWKKDIAKEFNTLGMHFNPNALLY